ncbi:MAG: EamA family transporter [Clostridia bacterium]|nr:EamA family transporter [Clostridia bacterium]
MLGYAFLFLSLFSGSAKGYCGKRISGFVSGYKEAALTNFIRMLICCVVGVVIALAQSASLFGSLTPVFVLAAFLSGFSTAFFIISWLVAVKKGAIILLDVFILLGVGVSLLLCRIFLNESIGLYKILGLLILIVAAYIMCSYNIKLKGKMTISSFLLLLVCGASSGITDFSQKLFITKCEGLNTAVFNLYSYVFSAIILAFFLLLKWHEPLSKPFKDNKKQIFITVIIMAIFLFLNSYFKTLAANYIPSDILYPLSGGLSVVFSAIMASFLFKEKLTIRAIIGIVLTVVALLVINFA